MLYLKKKSALLLFTVILSLSFAGCNVFDDAKHVLNHFCPKLKIGINGVHEHASRNSAFAIKSYIINYPDKYKNQVEKYFQETDGYTSINNANISSANTDLVIYVDPNDNVVGKRFKSGTDSAIVAFNKTKKSIIIIEYLTKSRIKK